MDSDFVRLFYTIIIVRIIATNCRKIEYSILIEKYFQLHSIIFLNGGLSFTITFFN